MYFLPILAVERTIVDKVLTCERLRDVIVSSSSGNADVIAGGGVDVVTVITIDRNIL